MKEKRAVTTPQVKYAVLTNVERQHLSFLTTLTSQDDDPVMGQGLYTSQPICQKCN